MMPESQRSDKNSQRSKPKDPSEVYSQARPAAHNAARKATTTAIANTNRCNGLRDMPGALRYQCPKSMAAIVTPSTSPPLTGSSCHKKIAAGETDSAGTPANQAP